MPAIAVFKQISPSGTLLGRLAEPECWAEFLERKRASGALPPRRERELAEFAESAGYLPVVQAILRGDGFPLPEKRLVNKLGSGKKRVVYSFPPAHTMVLKLLAHLLYRYDGCQPPGCYSFRQGLGAHTAIRALVRTPGIDGMWSLKLDVHDYFNSIEIPRLLPLLAAVVDDDPPLLAFLEKLLTADRALLGGQEVAGPRGVMAGVPIAPFLANLYLGGLDRHFAGVCPYARYSDDIIAFFPTRQAAVDAREFAASWLAGHGLRINPEKERLSAPGEPWDFLGVSYAGGHLDLSPATQMKLKGKIRRKARALRRWMLRKQAGPERAVGAMIRAYNRKFFEGGKGGELTWSRWFFPLLTRDDSLRAMDAHLQQYLRWIPSGRHRAANHRTGYADLKRLGYRTLVNEYHRYRHTREERQPEWRTDG
ncbi:MAG: hypothetical protein LBQ92_02500 [Propionibacteriaceae bacterium]|nr:hypothetical protein [Propionibacteriaceae bacterium]